LVVIIKVVPHFPFCCEYVRFFVQRPDPAGEDRLPETRVALVWIPVIAEIRQGVETKGKISQETL
jgi:hypothetical protein